MKHLFIGFISLICIQLASQQVRAELLDTSIDYQNTIGKFIHIFQSEDADLSLSGALTAYQNKQFSLSQNSVLNFGIGAKPVWLAFQVRNNRHDAILRNILFENSWLDKIDIYYFRNDQLINRYHIGDNLNFSQRPINHRFFVAAHHFGFGETTVLIRIESADAMVLPIYFLSTDQLTEKNMLQAYSYGFMYGVILALVAYNLMLFIGLRTSPYLFYSVYLLFFLALNAAYTGHGYQWLWPESPLWQQWSSPILILACTVSGFAFALHFLNINKTHPVIYRRIVRCCIFLSVALFLAMLADEFVLALLISFVFIFLFSILSIVLGVISLKTGNNYAKYFLLASIFTISGGAITSNAVWGFIPFNWFTYRATEIGMMIDAILLALALAERFNTNQNEKMIAERMAGTDSLTNLNNRRSFYKFVQPIWAVSLRNKSSTAIIILDIDNFKLLNDNHGHALGDCALVLLAETLQKEARGGDILARWGGEEFLIFLPETRVIDAVNIAERIRKKISAIQLMSDNKEKITFTASFGVAGTHNHNISLDELISRADQQLYRAKKQGRNRVCMDLPA